MNLGSLDMYLREIVLENMVENAGIPFNPFPNKPLFLYVCSTGLLKTLWKKEKLLVMSNSPFLAVFSTLLENFLPFSSNSKLSSANSFILEESEICHLGKN